MRWDRHAALFTDEPQGLSRRWRGLLPAKQRKSIRISIYLRCFVRIVVRCTRPGRIVPEAQAAGRGAGSALAIEPSDGAGRGEAGAAGIDAAYMSVGRASVVEPPPGRRTCVNTVSSSCYAGQAGCELLFQLGPCHRCLSSRPAPFIS